MVMNRKINKLVKNNYKQAAFSNKENADYFARAWSKRGYTVQYIRSSGPTVEGTLRRKAYYCVAQKR